MICHITVHTSKATETVDFYQWLLGLPIEMKIPTPNGDIIFMGDNETKFEIIPDSSAEKVDTKSICIGFSVNNLDEKIAMLEQRGIEHSSIISPMPTTKFVFFTDLNGCEVQLCEENKMVSKID